MNSKRCYGMEILDLHLFRRRGEKFDDKMNIYFAE
jgi:hypothetical protein